MVLPHIDSGAFWAQIPPAGGYRAVVGRLRKAAPDLDESPSIPEFPLTENATDQRFFWEPFVNTFVAHTFKRWSKWLRINKRSSRATPRDIRSPRGAARSTLGSPPRWDRLAWPNWRAFSAQQDLRT
jgi:hypothetical protein